MSDRTLDELATDVDDAVEVVEELQDDAGIHAQDKLDELHDKLEQAADAIDQLEDPTGRGR